ncbi:MAG: hypothetical protein ACREDP_22390 [Bradyrhizobium sp.]
MTSPIKVSVSTNDLRTLLQEDAKVYAELESMACEKIAEEITRKVTSEKSSIKKNIQTHFEAASREVASQYRASYTFPGEARQAIAEAVDKAITTRTDAVITQAKKELADLGASQRRLFENTLAEKVKQAEAALEEVAGRKLQAFERSIADIVEKQARASFIDVIREARGVIT